MNGIILAGGFGTRLMPLTEHTPKPMLTVANVPMLDYVVGNLLRHGIDDVTFTLGYLPEVIESHVKGYKDVKTRCITEITPLGTAGAVKNASDALSDVFVVMSGDTLHNVDLTAMLESHIMSEKPITIATVRVRDPRRYGVVQFDEDMTVTGFVEKPQSDIYGRDVNAGVYIINKHLLNLIPNDIAFDFSRDLFPSLVVSGDINVYVHKGYWCDIGDKRSYFRANFRMKNDLDFPVADNVCTAVSTRVGNSLISEDASACGTYKNCVIANAVVSSDAVLDGCIVLGGAKVVGEHRHEIIGKDFVEFMPAMPDLIVKNFNIRQNFTQNHI